MKNPRNQKLRNSPMIQIVFLLLVKTFVKFTFEKNTHFVCFSQKKTQKLGIKKNTNLIVGKICFLPCGGFLITKTDLLIENIRSYDSPPKNC